MHIELARSTLRSFTMYNMKHHCLCSYTSWVGTPENLERSKEISGAGFKFPKASANPTALNSSMIIEKLAYLIEPQMIVHACQKNCSLKTKISDIRQK